jgi:di/tricarboxylate transporter|tara:strand:- start:1308 stop:1499 length:192 start_codon:yes stop_codon:yes gene_type:complete
VFARIIITYLITQLNVWLFTAVAAPAYTIVYSSGLVNAKDFLKAGWKVGIVSIILVILYVNTF